MFGKSGTAAGETIPKHYNQFTGKFDNNSLKMGLRQWENSQMHKQSCRNIRNAKLKQKQLQSIIEEKLKNENLESFFQSLLCHHI